LIYLAWYLAVGVVILAVVFISHRLTTKDEFQVAASVAQDWRYERCSFATALIGASASLLLWRKREWFRIGAGMASHE